MSSVAPFDMVARFFNGKSGRSDNAEKEQQHTEMNDIAAIAAIIMQGQTEQGLSEPELIGPLTHPGAFDEFDEGGGDGESGDEQRQHRQRLADAGQQQDQNDQQARAAGQKRVFQQVSGIAFTPGKTKHRGRGGERWPCRWAWKSG